jgi:condensin complex subunit 3
LRDTTASNAFARFDSIISKKFEKQLEDFNEEQYRKLQELKELFEFLDDIIPDIDDIDTDVPKKKQNGARKR